MLVFVSLGGSTEAKMHDVVVAFVFLAIVILSARATSLLLGSGKWRSVPFFW
jgi:hypothetical protein